MNESPELKKALKVIAWIFLAYFAVFAILSLKNIWLLDKFGVWFRLAIAVMYLPFIVLMTGVVREKREHENLLPKVLVTFFLAVGSSLFLIRFLL